MKFQSKKLTKKYYLAPDKSEIRVLTRVNFGNLCHCTLPAGQISRAVYHKTIEELWYFLSGEGEMWRQQGDKEVTSKVGAGISVSIPVGTKFQFRNTGKTPLCIVIVSMPPWPGEIEAVVSEGKWKL
jgi:mannose-6-phosphate isomerase-like protein (cupin superfamily)